MPYISDQKTRAAIKDVLDDLKPVDKPGELNFTITALCHQYILEKGLSYDVLNEVIGVLSCVKTELERRVVAPYEDKKRLANGGVSELDEVNLEDVR